MLESDTILVQKEAVMSMVQRVVRANFFIGLVCGLILSEAFNITGVAWYNLVVNGVLVACVLIMVILLIRRNSVKVDWELLAPRNVDQARESNRP